MNKTYIDLDSIKLHGWNIDTSVPDSEPYVDWWHLTRKGYNCLAYLFDRLLGELLSNETYYVNT
jgi:hypothetical protein